MHLRMNAELNVLQGQSLNSHRRRPRKEIRSSKMGISSVKSTSFFSSVHRLLASGRSTRCCKAIGNYVMFILGAKMNQEIRAREGPDTQSNGVITMPIKSKEPNRSKTQTSNNQTNQKNKPNQQEQAKTKGKVMYKNRYYT